MKALAVRGYRAPMEVIELPRPEPGPGELLVRVRAAGVNPLDFKIRDGAVKVLLPFSFPLILGTDLAGDVEAIGPGVTKFKPGDAIYSRLDNDRIGAFAEYAVVRESAAAKKPARLDYTEAASLPLVGLTAWQALVELARLQPDQKVLIHAGSGGVGTFAIQLAKHLGAKVATTVGAKNHPLVKSLGADVVIDYKTSRFEAVVKDQDVILDTQGGATLLRSFDTVKPGGIVVTIGGRPDGKFARAWGLSLPLVWILGFLNRKVDRLARQRGVRFEYLFMRANGEQLERLATLVDQGAINPVLDKVFPFEAAAEAISYVESGRAVGKVVIRVAGEVEAAALPINATASMERKMSTHPPSPSHFVSSIAWRNAPTKRVDIGGTALVYRQVGPDSGVPVVFLNHLAAELDRWDPRVVDGIAAKRRVIVFDNRGIGASEGRTPKSVEAMARDAVAFIRALGLAKVDLFGFSLGGFISQVIAQQEPELVRKIILAGTGPAGGSGIDKVTSVTIRDMAKAAMTLRHPEYYLFFTKTRNGRRAAREFLARLQERTENRDKSVSITAFVAQLKAIHAWGRQSPADLSRIHHPVLVANGDDDKMVPSSNSVDLARRLPNAELVLYQDAGHGGVFQYHEAFVKKALEFLAA